MNITRSLFERVRSPGDLVEAYSIWSRLPIPDYGGLRTLTMGTPAASVLANQMIQNGLRREAIHADIDWVPIEYAIGKKITDDLDPLNTSPDYKTLLRKNSEKSVLHAEDVWSRLETACDPSVLDPLIDELNRHTAGRHSGDHF